MDQAAARELLGDLLTAEFAVAAGPLRPAATLRDDLDLDSLDVTELLQRIEESIGVEIEQENLDELVTLGDVLDLIERATSGSCVSERSAAAHS